MKPTIYYFLLLLSFACQTSIQPDKNYTKNQEALSTLEKLEVMEDFEVNLFAAEPLIADPVDMEIDENGNLYVVEMHGYPLDLSNSGVIKKLIDTDNDGLPDSAEVFADSLKLPTGIMRWKNGFIVTDAPDVFYLEDTNGDGKADKKETLLTGFALSNPQHNLNSPNFGLDNWIYLGHESAITPFVHTKEFGDEGEEVRFTDNAQAVSLETNANGRMVRFKPDTYQLEALSGQTQFGHTSDPWGHRIYTSNADHLFHEVIQADYLSLNSNLLVPDATQYIPDYGDAVKIFPITENPNHQLLTDVGVITSSCGVTWYNGGTFGETFNKVTFIAEPVHNLVHADIIAPNGATFTAKRLLENKEFLASKDPWFRPVNFYVGPDGALYVLDYYRQIIEHPEWMSEEVNQSGALYNGKDKGRIYKITPKNATKSQNWLNKLAIGKQSPEEWVALLDHTNGWYRQTAQRLLFQHNENIPIDALKSLLINAKNPEAKIPALWLLYDKGVMSEEILIQLLKDKTPGVRENAIKVTELHLRDGNTLSEKLTQTLFALKNDTDPKVRYQLLCTTGFLPNASSISNEILDQDIEDPWIGIAAIAAHPNKEELLLDHAITQFAKDSSANTATFFTMLAASIANAKNHGALGKIIHYNSSAWWQTPALSGINQLWQYKSPTIVLNENDKKALIDLINHSNNPQLVEEAITLLGITGFPIGRKTDEIVAKAKNALSNTNSDSLTKTNAIRLLSQVDPKSYREDFIALVAKKESDYIKMAALQALHNEPDISSCTSIIDLFPSFTEKVKQEAIAVLTSNKSFIMLLLEAIEMGKIDQSNLGWRKTVELMNYYDESIRNYARQLLAINEDRKAVLQPYLAVVNNKGDALKGKVLFEKLCATCHQAEGINGIDFGPNLATLKSRNPHSIITEIIHPNNSIADQYQLWEIDLQNGNKISGIINQENSEQVVLKLMSGEQTVISRSNISSMKKAILSAMPEGFENSISVEQIPDLVAFIKQMD